MRDGRSEVAQRLLSQRVDQRDPTTTNGAVCLARALYIHLVTMACWSNIRHTPAYRWHVTPGATAGLLRLSFTDLPVKQGKC